MKRTTLFRTLTWTSAAIALALAWANCWVTFTLLCVAGACAIAWMISDAIDYANEQERKNEYYKRLKQNNYANN